MSATDFGWYLKTFDALMAFLYLHHVNTTQKPVALRRHDWDWFLDRYHYHTFGSYNLMSGYAIETIIKCCLDNAGWTGNIFTHNLQLLAKELEKKWKITVPANVMGYLKECQEFIEWKGKYPMPRVPITGEGASLAIGGGKFTQTRDAWSFFFSELNRRDWPLASFHLTSYKYDSGQQFDDSMEAFDILDQIVKHKLSVCGKYVLYKRQFWRETFIKFMKWLEKIGVFKGYNVRNVNRREIEYLQRKLGEKQAKEKGKGGIG